MAAAPLILMGVGAAAGAYGTWRSGMAQAQNLKSEAKAEQYNATLAEQEAAGYAAQSRENEFSLRRRIRATMGESRAQLAVSGLSSQTAADLMAEAQSEAELDALNIRYDGLMKRRSKMTEAAMGRWRASMLKKQAKEAKVGTYLSMFGGAASAAGSMYGAAGAMKGSGTGFRAPSQQSYTSSQLVAKG